MIRSTIVTLAVFALAACQPSPSGTAITNVTVVDAINGVRTNQTVVFDGDEIIAIEAADAELNVAETIDGTDKYLMPGLWDFHVHLSYDDRFTPTMPAQFLSYGITSVRDTGGSSSFTTATIVPRSVCRTHRRSRRATPSGV